MQILQLQVTCSGVGRVVAIRDLLKENVPTGKTIVSARYEGGTSELIVATESLVGLNLAIGDIIDFWLDVEPADTGYSYQGRHISRPGFRVLSCIGLQKHADLDV